MNWTSADAVSGVLDFSTLGSTDGGAFAAWRNHPRLTTDTFLGQNSHTYAFYSVARDSAGQVEAPPGTPNAATTVTVGGDMPPRLELALSGTVPNPARSGAMIIRFMLPDRLPASIELLDVAGRLVMRRTVDDLGPGAHRLNLAGHQALEPGGYPVRLTRTGRALTRKTVVLP